MSRKVMKVIEVRKPTEDELASLGAPSWPTWGCEVSTFPWAYDAREVGSVLQGRVRGEGRDEDSGIEPAEFGPGDLVTFPKGLKVTWQVTEPVKKHYSFD